MMQACTERRWLELPERYAHGTQVPSPCISVCRVDPIARLCQGCLRTLDEIADWSVLDADEKRAVWAALPTRFDTLVEPTR